MFRGCAVLLAVPSTDRQRSPSAEEGKSSIVHSPGWYVPQSRATMHNWNDSMPCEIVRVKFQPYVEKNNNNKKNVNLVIYFKLFSLTLFSVNCCCGKRFPGEINSLLINLEIQHCYVTLQIRRHEKYYFVMTSNCDTSYLLIANMEGNSDKVL